MSTFDRFHGFTVPIGRHPLPGPSIPGTVSVNENPRVGVYLNVPRARGMPDGGGRPC